MRTSAITDAPDRRASTSRALSLLVLPSFCGAVMVSTLQSTPLLYGIGQLAGAVFFMQAFILLHEFGHGSFFASRRANLIGGYLASLLVFIPFPNWRWLHDLHHRWTGFRDLDPTTEATFAERLSPFSRRLVNVCWRWSLPLFTFGYRIGIFWNPSKLRRHLSPHRFRVCVAHIVVYLIIYVTTAWIAFDSLVDVLPAIAASFVICDVLTLSQHSHIEMPLAAGEAVRPISGHAQVQYTRSLMFPRWFAHFVLLNFNFHEAHHARPRTPCYRLAQWHAASDNAFAFLPWIRRVKSMSGVDFIFRTNPERRGF